MDRLDNLSLDPMDAPISGKVSNPGRDNREGSKVYRGESPMARRRFFVPSVRRGETSLAGDDAEHLVRVLRAEIGHVYEISDDARVYLAEITQARKSLVVFRVLEELETSKPLLNILLLPALFKFDRFEWLIEKATELDVSEIHPFAATRTDYGLAQASVKRLTRWQRIGLEASQQSRRDHLPLVHSTATLKQLLTLPAECKLMLDEAAGCRALLDCLPATRSQGDRVAVLLGPEGGWTPDERTEIIAAGWTACSLGSTILRAETAGIAALAILNAEWLKAVQETTILIEPRHGGLSR